MVSFPIIDFRNNNQFQINYIHYWSLLSLRSESRGWGKVWKCPGAPEHTQEAKRTFNTSAGYFWRVLPSLTHTGCTPLGMDLQNKIFHTKILMWLHSVYGQNILSEAPFALSKPPGVHHFRLHSPCDNCQGSIVPEWPVAGTILPAISQEGQIKGKTDWAAWN